MRAIALASLLLLAACHGGNQPAPAPSDTGSDAAAATPAPTPQASADPALCPALPKHDENALLERTRPLRIPASLRKIAVASMPQVAVTTLSGGITCLDVRWMERADNMALSADKRFLGFDWRGYEAYGHIVVDRSGAGQSIETGRKPRWSPSGKRLASVDLGESAFGALNAFAVWDVNPAGLTQTAQISDLLPPGEWRIDHWVKDGCVQLSLLPSEDEGHGPREPWFAGAAKGWRPQPGTCPAA